MAYLGLRLILVKVKNHRQELNIYICVFLGCFLFLTSRQGLFWTWRCLLWLVWLACLLCGFLVSTSRVLVMWGGRLAHSFFVWIWGIQILFLLFECQVVYLLSHLSGHIVYVSVLRDSSVNVNIPIILRYGNWKIVI